MEGRVIVIMIVIVKIEIIMILFGNDWGIFHRSLSKLPKCLLEKCI